MHPKTLNAIAILSIIIWLFRSAVLTNRKNGLESPDFVITFVRQMVATKSSINEFEAKRLNNPFAILSAPSCGIPWISMLGILFPPFVKLC